MAHTLEHHNKCVNELCRLCCSRSWSRKQKDSRKKPFPCSAEKDDIFLTCDINIENDISGKHSATMCSKCNIKIRTIKRRKSKRVLNNLKAVVSAIANVWTGFRPELSIGDCPVCAQHQALGAGGRLVKNPIPRVPVPCVPVHERETTPASPSNHQETDEYEETDDSNGRADTNTADPISPAATAPTTSMNSTHTDNQISPFLIVGEFNTPQPLASSTPTFTPTMVDSTTSPMDKHYSTFLAQSYEKNQDEPFTHLEEQVHTSFVRRKLYQNPRQVGKSSLAKQKASPSSSRKL